MRAWVRCWTVLWVLAAAPAWAAAVLRGPFLQQTTPGSTLIVVDTDVVARAQAQATGGGATVQSNVTDGKRHLLRLQGLAAATEYEYSVQVDGATVGTWRFKTPGAPNTEAGRRAVIGVVGDQGSGGANERANVARLKERGIDLLLTAGDNAYDKGTLSEWTAKFFQPFAPLLPTTTLMPTLGDHEYLTPRAEPSVQVLENPGKEIYYSFDWGDLHVVVVDTNCVSPVNAAEMRCTADELKSWLRDDLQESRAPWKIVTMHRPVIASGKYGANGDVADSLGPIFEAGGVDVVIQGHNHFYERTWPLKSAWSSPQIAMKSYRDSGGVVYMTSGGSGDWVYESPEPAPAYSAHRATAFQHLVLTLEGGRLSIESIRPDGSVLDAFTVEKTIPPLPVQGGGDGGSPGGGADGSGDGEWPGGLGDDGQGGCRVAGAVLPAAAVLLLALRRRRRAATRAG